MYQSTTCCLDSGEGIPHVQLNTKSPTAEGNRSMMHRPMSPRVRTTNLPF